MLRRLGYACRCLSVDDASPRGTILRNATPERLRALTAINRESLHRVLEFNAAHGVRMSRLASDSVYAGGASSAKAAALDRWNHAVRLRPDAVRARLGLEHDERLFGAEDVLSASAAPGVPMVLDVLHHRVYTGPDADAALPDRLRRAARTWKAQRDSVSRIHSSSEAAGIRRGAHAHDLDVAACAVLLAPAPADVAFDGMLEARANDLALFRWRDAREIAT